MIHSWRTGNPILVMDSRSAEMSKYAANAMLATKISSSTKWRVCASDESRCERSSPRYSAWTGASGRNLFFPASDSAGRVFRRTSAP